MTSLKLQVGAPIGAVRVAGGGSAAASAADFAQAAASLEQRLAAERAKVSSAVAALESAVAELSGRREKLLKEAESQVVDLVLMVARKILMQEVQAGHYQIEPIVKQALLRIGPKLDAVVRLNPEDLQTCQMAAAGSEGPGAVRFVPDATIGRGECVVETSEGMIVSTVDEHLREVGEALKGLQ